MMAANNNLSREQSMGDEKARIEHIDQIVLARKAEDEEHNAGIWETLRKNPKIIGLCFFANIGPLMYGFDNLATSLCLSMPAFQMQFGEMVNGSPVIAAWWQSLWNALAQVGTMLGAWLIGFVADRFGRKICFGLSAIISFVGIAILYICTTPGVFLAGKVINAFALGMAIAVGQTYVSEITPLAIRAIGLTAFTFSMNLGYMISASVAFKRLTIMNVSAYRTLFASAWTWPAILILFFWVIPESPYYLIRKGNKETARKELVRLSNSSTDIDATLADMELLVENEMHLADESRDVSFFELFKKNNWRRTRIILYCNGLSQMIGATFLGNAPYFLVSAGMAPTKVAMIVEIGISFAIASSIVTWFLLGKVGNRTLMLWGTGVTILVMTIVGVSGCFHTTSALWTTGIGLQLLWWCIGPCIGPAVAIAGQVSQARLRAKSQSFGFGFNYFYSAVWNVVVPYMFNTDQGNLGGKMGFIYLATAIIAFAIIYIEVPETKGRSFVELDEMFEKKVPARDFAKWNAFRDPLAHA